MKNIVIKKPIAFIDIESTGFNPTADRIVELTILKVLPDGTEELWSKRINPEIPIPISASEIHGITEKDITNEPTFKYYAKYLSNFLGNCDLGGYGITKFDLPILEAEFKRAGTEFSRKGRYIIDALVIFHQLEPRDLEAAYRKYCGKELKNAHTSHADVRATMEVLDGQLNLHPELPRNINELHFYCNPQVATWVDSEGKFIWQDGKATFNFGRYIGHTLEEIVKIEPSYLRWVANADFPEEVKNLVLKALNGEFPTYEK